MYCFVFFLNFDTIRNKPFHSLSLYIKHFNTSVIRSFSHTIYKTIPNTSVFDTFFIIYWNRHWKTFWWNMFWNLWSKCLKSTSSKNLFLVKYLHNRFHNIVFKNKVLGKAFLVFFWIIREPTVLNISEISNWPMRKIFYDDKSNYFPSHLSFLLVQNNKKQQTNRCTYWCNSCR